MHLAESETTGQRPWSDVFLKTVLLQKTSLHLQRRMQLYLAMQGFSGLFLPGFLSN